MQQQPVDPCPLGAAATQPRFAAHGIAAASCMDSDQQRHTRHSAPVLAASTGTHQQAAVVSGPGPLCVGGALRSTTPWVYEYVCDNMAGHTCGFRQAAWCVPAAVEAARMAGEQEVCRAADLSYE